MSVEVDKSKRTQAFLKCISDHLSGRHSCRGITYRVSIGVTDKEQIWAAHIHDDYLSNVILFSPDIQVFPSRYHRKETDKVSVVTHVITEHFPEIQIISNLTTPKLVDTDKLVRGIYEYQPSFDNKKRRWVRIA